MKYAVLGSMEKDEMNQWLKEGRDCDMVPVTLLGTADGWQRRMGESPTTAWMERFVTSGRGCDDGGRVLGYTGWVSPDQSNNHAHQEVWGKVERTHGLAWTHGGWQVNGGMQGWGVRKCGLRTCGGGRSGCGDDHSRGGATVVISLC